MPNSSAWFTQEHEQSLKDFWKVYSDHYDELNQLTLESVLEDPHLGALVRATPTEILKAQSDAGRERLRLAIIEGNWEQYETNLRTEGAVYAKTSIPYSSWAGLIRAYNQALVPLVVKAFSSEPQRLSAVLLTAQEIVDRALGIVVESYLEAREAAIRAGQQTLAATLDSIQEGVSILDEKGNITYVNETARQILKVIATDQPLAERIRRYGVFLSDGITLCPEELNPGRRALHGEKVREFELFMRNADIPNGIYLSVNAGPIRGKEGALLGAVTSFRDISYRKHMEEERRKREEVEFQSRRIQEANRLKSEFLANMSHELRTPLNSIIGFAELLHDGEVGPLDPKQREFVGDILTSGKHLHQLINDVLDLSKVEAGKIEFHPESFEPGQLINEVMTILRNSATGKNIKMEMSIHPELKELVIDPARLKQVLYNYLSNALKFTPEHGKVAVRALPEGEDAFRLEVEDNGLGIAASDLGRLFVEFQQLDAGAAKKHGGTGLGLALTKRLVEAQGGQVGVRSEPGRSTVFNAVLPRRSGRGAQTLKPPAQLNHPSNSPRILVVDDDDADSTTLQRLLTEAGFSVEVATTGSQAIARCQESAFDAVTLDLLLPDMSGLDVLRAIRTKGPNANTVVVVVTVVAERIAAGFAVQDVLSKPIDGPTLLDSLRRAGVTPHSGGPIMVIDDDAGSLRLMAVALEQLGFRAMCFEKGEEALSAAAKERPSGVILDLLMPGMDGFQFLEQFRQLNGLSKVPVLIWTVKDLSNGERERLYANAQAVLQKGTGPSELVTALEHLLPQPPHAGR
jgi:signal transduction histidine kinase/DNA-binding response OmpR family regulator/PAS domain-containing protein